MLSLILLDALPPISLGIYRRIFKEIYISGVYVPLQYFVRQLYPSNNNYQEGKVAIVMVGNCGRGRNYCSYWALTTTSRPHRSTMKERSRGMPKLTIWGHFDIVRPYSVHNQRLSLNFLPPFFLQHEPSSLFESSFSYSLWGKKEMHW